jgi:hypothetical protein
MIDDFRSPTEELNHLLKQVTEIKDALREIGARVLQIERHVKRAFGVAADSEKKQPAQPRRQTALPPPTVTPAEALKLFDELLPLLRSAGPDGVRKRLSSVEVSDLKLLVQELGAPLPSKPSRSALTSAILSRASESILLSRNRNVRAPDGSSKGEK